MRVEDIVNESTPTTSLILSEKGRTLMSRLVKRRILFCSIHDVEFNYLVNEHKIGNRKILSRKFDFVPAGSPYSVLGDREHDHE